VNIFNTEKNIYLFKSLIGKLEVKDKIEDNDKLVQAKHLENYDLFFLSLK